MKEYTEQKKECSACTRFSVCEYRYSWLDQEDNTKYTVCQHFKDNSDVVEIVRCKDCVHAKELTEQDKKMHSENCVMCTALNPFGNRVPMEKENYCSLGYKKCGAKMDGGKGK